MLPLRMIIPSFHHSVLKSNPHPKNFLQDFAYVIFQSLQIFQYLQKKKCPVSFFPHVEIPPKKHRTDPGIALWTSQDPVHVPVFPSRGRSMGPGSLLGWTHAGRIIFGLVNRGWLNSKNKMMVYLSGWCFGTSILFSHILGISSSQLTFIFFRGVAPAHQPVIIKPKS